jgi:hypothetical protein
MSQKNPTYYYGEKNEKNEEDKMIDRYIGFS